MTKRAGLGFVLAIMAGACASTGPGTQASSSGLSADDIITGFRTAVVDVCVATAMAGTEVADLASETGPVVRETDPQLLRLVNAQPGDEVWSSRAAKGIVLIRSNDQECEVSAHGPPVQRTLEVVGQGLADPHGFVLTPTEEMPARSTAHQLYTRKTGEQSLQVSLSGSEPGAPGAMSRFSTVVATVKATPANA